MNEVPFRTSPGRGFPPGASVSADGVNFSIFSRHASHIWLNLYRSAEARKPAQIIELDPSHNRTFFFWHVFVENAGPGLYYTWRTDGPDDTSVSGLRFDPRCELLDPWAKALSALQWDRNKATHYPGEGAAVRALVVADDDYDWGNDKPVRHQLQDSVIYELHVGGFTRHSSSGVNEPGCFRGLIEKIPYLKSLGITDVELLPVMAFDSQDVPEPVAERGLENYWGYSPYGFFAPHPAYSRGPDPRRDFRDMVKALHHAGIGVILDVVFNHTAEGNEHGPHIHFKGLANDVFYHLDPRDRRHYLDFTGCGNTVNCNHPLVARLLLQSIEYWVREMHVDGFRFDLASVLTRGEDSRPMDYAPLLLGIEFSEVAAHTKLIAEAWDASGTNQLGNFPGMRWAEWNGNYRDVVRRFVCGEPGIIGQVASRIAGSSDLFSRGGWLPTNSINFVTCHDGFTLQDLVSFNEKHNEDNGEQNRDGQDQNHSWNCGAEGLSDDPEITALRRRQVRNLVAILFLSQGIPMLLAGDEVLRSQRGNNNAYCQDNELSWMDWSLLRDNADMLRFTREMIALRQRHPALRRNRYLTGAPGSGQDGLPDICWYGKELQPPDWDDPQAGLLAFTLAGRVAAEPPLHVIMNMSPRAVSAAIPQIPGWFWRRAVDTTCASPGDILTVDAQPAVDKPRYQLNGRSVVVLEAVHDSRSD